jgi:hypothetical protein
MVLDAKALTWAGKNDIDTAKLKKAKVPIYGKWYFPEIPADVPLVNLETGEQQVFKERMIAGEVMYAPVAELQRAGLVPADFVIPESVVPIAPPERALRTIAPEPLLAMARPPDFDDGSRVIVEAVDSQPVLLGPDEATGGIHLPSASITPFVLGVGFCIVMLGLITSLAIVVVGLVWMAVGAIGWIRIGMEELRASEAHSLAEEHS